MEKSGEDLEGHMPNDKSGYEWEGFGTGCGNVLFVQEEYIHRLCT